MLHPKLGRLARWMQGIGKQQQTGSKIVALGTQHRGLPASIGMSAEKYLFAAQLSRCGHGVPEPFTITLGIPGPGRTKRTILPKRQIATQHAQAGAREYFRQRDQKRSVGV